MGRSPVLVTFSITPSATLVEDQIAVERANSTRRAERESVGYVSVARAVVRLAFLTARLPDPGGADGRERVRGGRREETPYSASATSPSSVAIGSCTVTSLVPSGKVPPPVPRRGRRARRGARGVDRASAGRDP